MSNSTQTARQSVLVDGLFWLDQGFESGIFRETWGFWDSEKNELGKQGERAARGSAEDERR